MGRRMVLVHSNLRTLLCDRDPPRISGRQQQDGIDVLDEGIRAMQQAMAASAQSIESTQDVADAVKTVQPLLL